MTRRSRGRPAAAAGGDGRRAVSGAEVPVSQPAHRRYRMGEEARGAPHMSAPAALAVSWVLTQTNVVGRRSHTSYARDRAARILSHES
eukprot:COSAG01_NODE_483_length_16412_cov_17.605162_10_plen_88_part_00